MKKPDLMVLFGKGPKRRKVAMPTPVDEDSDESSYEGEDDQSMLHECAMDVIKGVQDDDPELVAKALEDAFLLLQDDGEYDTSSEADEE